MTGVVEGALGRAAVQASRPLLEPLLRKFKRNLAKRGYGPADVLTLLERTSGPHNSDYWPASLVDRLPHGVTQKHVDAFIKTPEFATCARHALAVAIMNAETAHRHGVLTNVTLLLLPHLPGTSREKVAPYADAFVTHLFESCRSVARKLRDSIGSPEELISWAESTIVAQTLVSIDKYTSALVAQHESRDDHRRWIDAYRRRFADAHRMIEVPDLSTRRMVDHTRLFVPPSLGEVDGDTLLPRTDRVVTAALPDLVGRTVLLGDPGAGKSTASTVAAVVAAEEGGMVPFLVVLRHVAEPEFSLVDLVRDQLGRRYQTTVTRGSVERLLHEGEALLVFDGLDEIVRGEDRVRFARTIESVARAYPFARILVTSRIIGYPVARLDPVLFDAYFIRAFDRARVDRYVENWFSHQELGGRRTTEQIVSRFTSETATLPDLVSNPLLLAFICVLYRGRKTIPRTRARLYSRCVELLLGEWDKTRGIIDEVPDLELVQIALSRIAALGDRTAEKTRLTARDIEVDLVPFLLQEGKGSESAARRFVGELLATCRGRAWIFTDYGLDEHHEEVFQFTHGSFQEYFSALYLVRNCGGDSARVAGELYPHAVAGRAEVYSQICVSLHNMGNRAGGSEVLLEMLSRMNDDHPPPALTTDVGRFREQLARRALFRESVLRYVAKMSDCIPLSRAAVERLLGEVVRQVPQGRVGAMSVLLESTYHHREVVVEVLGDLVRGTVDDGVTDDELVHLWFAIHAGYLANSVEDGLSPGAVRTLRKVVRKLMPHVERLTADRGELGFAIRCQAGAVTGDDFAAGSEWRLRDAYTSLFQCFDQLIPSLGPGSSAIWVVETLASPDRRTAPMAAVGNLLRALTTGVRRHGPSFDNLLVPSRAGTGSWGVERSVEAVLRRASGYPPECREGLAYVMAGCVELAELWHNDRSSRSLLYEWASAAVPAESARDFLDGWAAADTTVWKSEGQGVS